MLLINGYPGSSLSSLYGVGVLFLPGVLIWSLIPLALTHLHTHLHTHMHTPCTHKLAHTTYVPTCTHTTHVPTCTHHTCPYLHTPHMPLHHTRPYLHTPHLPPTCTHHTCPLPAHTTLAPYLHTPHLPLPAHTTLAPYLHTRFDEGLVSWVACTLAQRTVAPGMSIAIAPPLVPRGHLGCSARRVVVMKGSEPMTETMLKRQPK